MRYIGLPSSMRKWFGMSTIVNGSGELYATRIWLGRLRLHIFYRGDTAPDPHDHPWPFWTFPLTSYWEEKYYPMEEHGWVYSYKFVRRFRLHYRSARYTHRVLGRAALEPGDEGFCYARAVLSDKPIVTVVWRGRSERTWGFLRRRNGQWCWTDWRDYIFGGGRDAPC